MYKFSLVDKRREPKNDAASVLTVTGRRSLYEAIYRADRKKKLLAFVSRSSTSRTSLLSTRIEFAAVLADCTFQDTYYTPFNLFPLFLLLKIIAAREIRKYFDADS